MSRGRPRIVEKPEFGWDVDANCADVFPRTEIIRGKEVHVNIFYPPQNSKELRGRWVQLIDEAKAICAACEVRVECLDYALSANEPDGIWGGHTTRERRKMLRRRAASAAISSSVTRVANNEEGLSASTEPVLTASVEANEPEEPVDSDDIIEIDPESQTV